MAAQRRAYRALVSCFYLGLKRGRSYEDTRVHRFCYIHFGQFPHAMEDTFERSYITTARPDETRALTAHADKFISMEKLHPPS
jgi:hypothetical protein